MQPILNLLGGKREPIPRPIIPAPPLPLAQRVDETLDQVEDALKKRRDFLLERIRTDRDEVLALEQRLSRITPFIPDDELARAIEGALDERPVSESNTEQDWRVGDTRTLGDEPVAPQAVHSRDS